MSTYRCSVCNLNTDDRSNYYKHTSTERHRKKMNGEPTKKTYKCEVEGCLYKTMLCQNFAIHKRVHLVQKAEFKCLACDQEVRDKYSLSRHYKTEQHVTNVLEKYPEAKYRKEYIKTLD